MTPYQADARRVRICRTGPEVAKVILFVLALIGVLYTFHVVAGWFA